MPRDPRTNPAAFLGAELRRARIAAGFTSQPALAAKLNVDRTVISKTESGERAPADAVLAAWCEACSLDLDLFSGLAAVARSSDGPVPTWFEDWLAAEQEAEQLWIWQPLLIPGLFQTPDYARALFVAAQTDTSDEAIDALVTARMERRSILDKPEPPDVIAVLDEPVLHRLIGSAAVMHDALMFLLELSLKPYVVVQVVPASNGANAGLGGAFDIASSDGAPNMLRMEGVEDQSSERRALIRRATVAWNRVRGDALPREASRTLIREVAEQWKNT